MSETQMRRSATDVRVIEALASALDIAIIIFDRHDTVVAASPEFQRFFSVSPEFLEPGVRLRDLLGAAYDAGARILGSVNGGVRTVTREDWIAERIALHWRERYESIERLCDGRWVRLCKRRMPDGVLVSTITDVSEQKRRDIELTETRHQAELAQHILDNLATPVMVKDESLRYVIVNDAFCRIPGLHAKHVVGRTASELVNPELAAQFEKVERGVLETGVPYETTEEIFRADGTVMHAITRARRSGAPGNYYVTVSFDDVSAFAASMNYSARATSRYDISPPLAYEIPDPAARTTQMDRILVLDEDKRRSALRVAALKAAGTDAVALDDVDEVIAFLNTLRSMGLALGEVEITAHMAGRLESVSGLDRHPVLRLAIERMRAMDTCAPVQTEPLLPRPGHEPAPSIVAAAPLQTVSGKDAHQPIEQMADRLAIRVAVPGSNAAANSASRRARVLVAEDNDVNQIVFEQILEGMDVDFRIACNGEEAVAAWRADEPDLILMDISMPIMNGLQAALAIRQAENTRPDERHVPIIAVTAHAMSGDRERCFAAGMDDYLSKPVSPEKLEALIGKWTSNSAAVLLAS